VHLAWHVGIQDADKPCRDASAVLYTGRIKCYHLCSAKAIKVPVRKTE